jgi:hypothetical protein
MEVIMDVKNTARRVMAVGAPLVGPRLPLKQTNYIVRHVMNNFLSFLAAGVMILGLPTLALADHLRCGRVIVSDIRLDADLACTGTHVIIF